MIKIWPRFFVSFLISSFSVLWLWQLEVSVDRWLHQRRGQQPGQIYVQTVRNRLRFDGLYAEKETKAATNPQTGQVSLCQASHAMERTSMGDCPVYR